MDNRPSDDARKQARFLAAVTATAGVLHFIKPEPFDGLIPERLPGSARFWTLASGAAELGVAAGLMAPSTRRAAGRAASVLFAGVFPGNLQMAWNWRKKPWYLQLVSLGRLPLQADLIRRAELVHREG